MDTLTSPQKGSSSRIARNTLFLYLRMLITIVVNLYSMKVLWLALGLTDYGVYSLIGGFVMMFSFISSSMTGAIQRYMAFAIGKNDEAYLNKVFSISLKVQVILIAIVLLLGESAGLWAVNCWLKIPAGKETAANWVYQCCLIAFLLNIINVPYNAAVVAHEHMHIYGYYGIIEVFLKLAIVLVISILPGYRLIAYSVLLVAVSVIMRLLYGIYCHRHFKETHYSPAKDAELIREMLHFQKWTFIGLIGFAARDGGIGVILNRFFDIAVIAAKGIASQVGNVISGFASNFTMALNPQIIKRYASGEVTGMLNLLFTGSKYSLILMAMVVIPLFVSSELVLTLWLKDITSYTVGFLKLVLIVGLIESVVSPITTGIQATGKIKIFQIIISLIMVSILPIGWIWMKYCHDPYLIYIVMVIMAAIGVVTRIIILHGLVKFKYTTCFRTIYLRTVPSIIIGYIISQAIYPFFSYNFVGLVLFAFCSVSIIVLLCYFIALNGTERTFVDEKIRTLAQKLSQSKK